MIIKPINNNIIFTFVDRVNTKGEFEKDQTDSGILLQANFDDSAKSPRWVNVIAVGPECKDIQVGMQVLLPNLRWTSGVKVNNRKVWRSDETQVVAHRASPQSEIVPIGNNVLFTQVKKEAERSFGSIILVGGNDDTPSGVAVSVGPKGEQSLVGATFYYDDTNFTDTFFHGNVELSFIKDDLILAFVA